MLNYSLPGWSNCTGEAVVSWISRCSTPVHPWSRHELLRTSWVTHSSRQTLSPALIRSQASSTDDASGPGSPHGLLVPAGPIDHVQEGLAIQVPPEVGGEQPPEGLG